MKVDQIYVYTFSPIYPYRQCQNGYNKYNNCCCRQTRKLGTTSRKINREYARYIYTCIQYIFRHYFIYAVTPTLYPVYLHSTLDPIYQFGRCDGMIHSLSTETLEENIEEISKYYSTLYLKTVCARNQSYIKQLRCQQGVGVLKALLELKRI